MVDLDKSAEKLLQKDYIQNKTTNNSSMKPLQEMVIFTNDLDKDRIKQIRDSLLNHYMFKEMSTTLM
jgi:hypothetical protein